MKKLSVFIMVLSFVAFTGLTNAQESVTENSSFLHVGMFKPNPKYLIYPKSIDITIADIREDDDFEPYGIGINFELGNLYNLTDIGDHALMLRVSWFDANYYTNTEISEIGNSTIHFIQASIGKVGPNFTFALNQDMGIDGFYQLAPVFATYILNLPGSFGDSETYTLGVLNTVGASFRYKMLAAGFNFNFGTSINLDENVREFASEKGDYKHSLGSFRFFLGLNF